MKVRSASKIYGRRREGVASLTTGVYTFCANVGDDLMPVRFIGLAMLLFGSTSALAKEVSPQVIACQDEATKRYIADIRQIGLPKRTFDGFPIVVTTFQNDNPRFEEYVAECMNRRNEDKAK